MDMDADANAAPSPSERVLRHLDTSIPDCNVTILSRALLINFFGETIEGRYYTLLALSPIDLARRATQCSTEAESEWEHVGALEVALCRDWLLFVHHVADVYLDLFHERGPTRPPRHWGRMCVAEVEELMWPAWARDFPIQAVTEHGPWEPMITGLSRPYFPCQEPPGHERFTNVTLRTKVLQVATAAKKALQYVCVGVGIAVAVAALCPALVIIYISLLGVLFSPGVIFFLCCLPAMCLLLIPLAVAACMLELGSVAHT